MAEEFNTSTPIYLQLAERINRKIIRNELKNGEKLPSVREMAMQAGVNPNTVQRTYNELEQLGIVETRRGQGTFVTEDQTVLIQLRDRLKNEYIQNFIKDMEEIGFTEEEIITGLHDYLNNRTYGV